jgi:hypothetical protein
MSRSHNVGGLACCLALGALAAGCQTPDTSLPSVRRPSLQVDPCAERLHDLCGKLLLYHGIHSKLPGTLEELKALGSATLPPLVCPVSGKPYIYHPDGLAIRGWSGRLVLYDAMPSHSGMRWGVLVEDPGSGKTLTARVLLLPEQSVLSAGEPP